MCLNKLRQLPASFIRSLENPDIPFYQYVLIAVAATMIRHVLESFSQPVNLFYVPASASVVNVFHFGLYYFAIALTIAVIAHYVISESIDKILRVILPSMLIIVFVPILDLLLTGGKGALLLYLLPEMVPSVWKVYFTYASGYPGASLGLKIEVFLVFLSMVIYARVKNKSIYRGLFLGWAAYTVIFFYSAMPIFDKTVTEFFGYQFHKNVIMYLDSFLIINLVLLFWTGYLFNKNVFVALLKDLRVLRILYSELSLLFGVALALSLLNMSIPVFIQHHSYVIYALVLTAISIFLASISIVMINNLYDVAIDRVSNPRRPLVSGSIDVLLYEKLAYIFMVLALVFAYEASGHVLVVIAAIISNYYIYSVPPVRFKRVPVLSKLVIGFNSFMLVFLGFILIQDLKYFPHALGWIYFAGLTLAANFIDLKDIAGDRAAGMLTLPILLGERSAKILIGLSLFLMSLSFYFVFAVPLPWYCYFISGVFYIYLVNKQHYHDWQVMLLSDVNFAIMIIYLLAIT